MAKKRASRSNKTIAKNSPRLLPSKPTEDEEQKVKVEMPLEVGNAGDPVVKTEEVAVKPEHVEERVLNLPPKPSAVPSFDRDFSPPDDYVPPQERQWTPDGALIGAVDEFFNTVASGYRRRTIKYKPIICSNEVRGELRNMFMAGSAADKFSDTWEDRLENEELKAAKLQQSNQALGESCDKVHLRKKAAIDLVKKYSVDDTAQKAAIDLANIRYEELTMDMSMDCDSLLEIEQQPDNEMDMSMNSSGVARYSMATTENELAKRCLIDVGRLVQKTKERMVEKDRLRKKGQELDRQLAKLAAQLRAERRKVGGLSIYVDEVLESAAWKEKNNC